jgi:hypothetical protein
MLNGEGIKPPEVEMGRHDSGPHTTKSINVEQETGYPHQNSGYPTTVAIYYPRVSLNEMKSAVAIGISNGYLFFVVKYYDLFN